MNFTLANNIKTLPEFRVILERVKPGETAYPMKGGFAIDDHDGQRTKLGGEPEYIQGGDGVPDCPSCSKPLLFVAQIDSVEHDWLTNPHRVNSISPEQEWMFGDVGMIYVYFCKECLQAHAEFECG